MNEFRYFSKNGKIKQVEASKVSRLYVHNVGATHENGGWNLPNSTNYDASEMMEQNQNGLFEYSSGRMCDKMRLQFKEFYGNQINVVGQEDCIFRNQTYEIWEFKTKEVADKFAYLCEFVYEQVAEFVNPEEPAFVFKNGKMARLNIADFPENFEAWGWQDKQGYWINSKAEGYTLLEME